MKLTIAERVKKHIDVVEGPLDTPCHIWNGATGAKPRRPYMMSGSMTNGTRRPRAAHRLLWVEVFGEPAEGYDVHHKCLNRMCMNILHFVLLLHPDHVSLHRRESSPEELSLQGKSRMHIRWHKNRGIVSAECEFCS